MTFLDVVQPGDKIDIQQVSGLSMKDLMEETIELYYSTVLDCISETELEIAMPTEGTKLVLFHEGMRINMLFYTEKGMYHCVARIKDRFKQDNLNVLSVELNSRLEKSQRRDYFRIECSIDMKTFHIAEEVAESEEAKELFVNSMDLDTLRNASKAKILDISGGGIRFASHEQYTRGEKLLFSFLLDNSRISQTFNLIGQIVLSEAAEIGKFKYINRCKFIYKGIKDRESIIQYIFEEDRVQRQKEVGEFYEKKYSGS